MKTPCVYAIDNEHFFLVISRVTKALFDLGHFRCSVWSDKRYNKTKLNLFHLIMLTFSIFTGLYDLEYQNSTTLVSASWHGYIDLESYIDHYVWCVGTDSSDPDEASIVTCVPVGLRLRALKHLGTPLNHGMKIRFV